MGYGPQAGLSNIGLRMLLDTYLNFYGPGMAVYLRYQNVDTSESDAGSLGFIATVSGGDSGFTDVLVAPQPIVAEVSKHNIGISGGKLMFGAKSFQISATFVNLTMRKRNYTDPYQVWRDPLVMGIVYNQRLYSIESIQQNDIGGQPLLWDLTCNMLEQPVVPSGPGEIPPPEQGG